MRSFILLLALFCVMPALLRAQGSGTVNSLALPSYAAPGYVIAADGVDSDPGTNRHLVAVRANCTVNTIGNYAVEFSLLDPNNVVMATVLSSTVSVGVVPDTRNYNADLEPTAASALQPGVLYRLRARLLHNATTEVDKMTGSPGRTYLHFTGTDPLSIDRNALTEVTSVTIDRSWMLETNPSRTTIPVTVGYTIHRYDRWTTTPQNVDLDVTLTPTLTNDDSSTAVAVTATDNSFTVLNVPGHASGTPVVPSATSGTQTIQVDPSVILKPQMHHIDVQGSHIDIPASMTSKAGSSMASASTAMSHFTGKLTFDGSIVTHFSSVASAPFIIPTISPPGVIQQVLRINPDGNSGSVDTLTGFTFGDGSNINVVLDEFGDASYTGHVTSGILYISNPVFVTVPPASQYGSYNGVQYYRPGPVELNTGGAHAPITARLPTGVGWAANRTRNLLNDEIDFGVVDLNQAMVPLAATITKAYAANTFFLCEETKPLYIQSTELTWDTIAGEFRAANLCAAHSIRQPLLDFLSSYSYADPSLAEKKSNDHVFNRVTGATTPKFKTGTSGGGEMTAVLAAVASSFKTHMPYDAEVKYTSLSAIQIVDDLVTTTGTSHLNSAVPLTVNYNQHCQEALDAGCGSALTASVTFTSATAQFAFTADGGLHATGSVAMTNLAWGAIPKKLPTDPQEYAHQVTTSFTNGNFHMPGSFLRGDLNALTDEDGPGVLLLTGVDPATLAATERPYLAAYLDGLGDYAGINYRCSGGGFSGLSTLQGDPYGSYPLTTRCKYYSRLSGVTGIHEAATGFPGTATISSYQFMLDTFGFSFLSTEMEDSRTGGDFVLPAPTNFTLEFSELALSCLGALESFEINGAGSITKEFDFWNCNFTPYTASFVSNNTCDPGDGTTFVLGFGAFSSHIADEIVGTLGILADGSFVRPSEIVSLVLDPSVPTRIRLPGSLEVIGSTGEIYDFFPSQGAYLSDEDGATEGYWSLFGSFDVPFFRDMQVHLHTRCVAADNTSVLYVMGGWPTNGWMESSMDPFTDTTFDDNNKGFTGTTLALYRDSGTSESYKPRAQQEWLGVLDFDYPLQWSNIAFNFTGLGPISKDVIVVQTQHELQYMDAENAEITFGVRYDGLPEISLTNFVFNAVDDATGTASAMIAAAGDKVFGSLENGVDELANTVSDKAEDMLGTALDAVMKPVLDDLIDDLKVKISSGTYTTVELEAIITAHFTVGAPGGTLKDALNTLDDATTFLQDLDARLAKIQYGIDSVINTVTVDPDTGVALPVEQVANGLLKQVEVNGEMRRVVFEALASSLVSVLSDVVDASEIEEELTALVQEAEPTLDSITTVLTDVRDLVQDVRDQISTGVDMAEEIKDLINSPTGGQIEIANISAELELVMKEIVLSATTQDLARLDDLAEEWRSRIEQEIRHAFYATELVADIQEAVKERLFDLQASFNEAVDSAFAALNDAIREALSDVLAELDTSINNTLGSFGDKLGAGSLTGYARIYNDSLEELRIDGAFELDVPDPLSLNAYLIIKSLDSDGPEACTGPAGAMTTEVTIGTTDMAIGLTGLGGDGVHADMSVKFGLNSSGVPISMGGAFEMTSGTISFETFEIYKLAADVMFGSTENYIAAAVGLRFGEYDVAGGVFLGKSCDLDPLKMIDPLVAEVVPTSSITGIYAYGEATFPIYGTGTCFFNISAKAGAGVFYFQEGPTYGGRMTLGVYGEALCAVEVGAEISLAGSKSGDSYNFAGHGRVFGQAGKCPLCVKANFQVDFKYTDAGGWDVDF
ncbi:MAG: apolipoprotein A1/A4/E family protein [Verrucomicrobiaceae bacterium]|nr:apolipoprotein A1/A4/E family protein [Verrucomicrobiaceae bacterium]